MYSFLTHTRTVDTALGSSWHHGKALRSSLILQCEIVEIATSLDKKTSYLWLHTPISPFPLLSLLPSVRMATFLISIIICCCFFFFFVWTSNKWSYTEQYKSEAKVPLALFWIGMGGGGASVQLVFCYSQEIPCQRGAWSCFRTVRERGRESRKKGRKKRGGKEGNVRPCGDFPLTARPPLWHVVDKCQRAVNSLQINCLSRCKSATQPQCKSTLIRLIITVGIPGAQVLMVTITEDMPAKNSSRGIICSTFHLQFALLIALLLRPDSYSINHVFNI